jgi:diaminopimelate decarboxylase
MHVSNMGNEYAKTVSSLRPNFGYNNFIVFTGMDTLISERPLSWWLSEFELPLHINFESIIRKNIRAFKSVFSTYYPKGEIRYAAKTYCHPSLFRIIREEGAGVDASSFNELRAVLESGILPKRINLNGNSKEDFLIEKAIDKEILIISDSVEELQIISKLAAAKGKKAQVLIRVSGFDIANVTDEVIFTSGVWTKFGISREIVEFLIDNLERFPGVELCGFHMHIGSQIVEKENFLYALGILIELGHKLKNSGQECKIINMGGGFPLSYVNKTEWNNIMSRVKEGMLYAKKRDYSKLYVWNNEYTGYIVGENGDINFDEWRGEAFYSFYSKEKMLAAILNGMVKVEGARFNTVKALEKLGCPQLFIEPGRSIVGDAGVTLARVNHVKKMAFGHNLLVLEMGAVNYAGSVIHKLLNHWTIINDNMHVVDNPFEAFACGNLCYNGDIISKYKIRLQRAPQRGDIVLIYDTGGTESHFFSSNANSYPRPSRVMVDEQGNIIVTKRRETYEEIFNL